MLRVGSDHRPGRILDLRILVESQIMVDLVVNQERLCVSINLNWVDLKFSFWSKKSNDQAEGGKLWDDLNQCQLNLSPKLPAPFCTSTWSYMVEYSTILWLQVEFENVVMTMVIANPDYAPLNFEVFPCILQLPDF